MIISATVVLLLVRYGLVAGLERLADALNWTPKVRGQTTGYATSAPELVTLVAAGLSGVWEAGLWNIAASNIINITLMSLAVIRYRQGGDLMNRRFVDEILFAGLAVLAPLVLMQFELDREPFLVPVLLGFFILYRLVDRRLNPGHGEAPAQQTVGNVRIALIMTISALVCIAIAGVFLGSSTEEVVNQMGIHPAIAGWILGLMTSLPEMVTFFAVYATAKREGKLELLEDTQEALDNLAASNMANAGLIYPLGLAAFWAATWLGV